CVKGDGLRGRGGVSPSKANGDFGTGIGGKGDAAYIGLAAADAQFGLANAAGFGRIELYARAVLAHVGPLSIHIDHSLWADRFEGLAGEAKEGICGRWSGRAGDGVGEFSIGEDLGPHLRGGRLHVAAKEHGMNWRAGAGGVDNDLDVWCGVGEGLYVVW